MKFCPLISALTWILLAFSLPHAAHAGRKTFTCDMTVAEARAVIGSWLESRGFETYLISADTMRSQIAAEKQEAKLHITLKPHSPLATKVVVEAPTVSSAADGEALAQYLRDYLSVSVHEAQPAAADMPHAVRMHAKAVICIFAERDGQVYQFSGFIIDPAGMAVSTAHDLYEGQPVRVVVGEGLETNGQVVKIDAYRDLSLIQLDLPKDTAIPLRNGRYLIRNGEPLFALTCQADHFADIQSGRLDGPPRRVESLPLWQVRMRIASGSSGSPVFDEKGRLAGIVKGRYRGRNNVGFLIPFETLLHFLQKY